MSQELLRDALEQAGRVSAAVRSAALCHIARVLAKSDPADGQRVLEEGLALAASLPDQEEREILLGEGAVLAATIVPARAFEILAALSEHRPMFLNQALCRMIDHGFRDAAADYLLESPLDGEFSYGIAMNVVGSSNGPEIKRRMLRRAIAAMREADAGRRSHPAFGSHDFVRFFVFYWRLLPAEEARAAVREQVQRILSEPDSPMNGGFSAGSVKLVFTSRYQQALFEILEPLQELDHDLAASIIPRYPELSAAAWRFPYGERSITERMEKDVAAARDAALSPTPDDWPLDMDCVPVGRHVPMREAIRTGFSDAFAAAMDRYDDDTDPDDYNEVPQQCWPSAAAFRAILYKAGRYEGAGAARHLDRIPDPALRLFAQIELAAALAGLPQLGSTEMRRGARARRRQERMQASADGFEASMPPGMRQLPPPRKPDLPPARELRVSPAAASPEDGVSGGSGRDFVEIRNASLGSVIAHLFEIPPTRIVWDASIDRDARYDFVLVLPDEVPDEERRRLLVEGIARQFGIRMSIDERPLPVWVVTAPNGVKVRERRTREASGFGSIGISSQHSAGRPLPDALRLQQIFYVQPGFDPGSSVDHMAAATARALAAMGGAGASIDGVEGEFTVGELCSVIEPGLDRPLVDETGLRGRYVIAFESTDPGAFLRAVMDRLGLVLSEAERTLSALVISNQ